MPQTNLRQLVIEKTRARVLSSETLQIAVLRKWACHESTSPLSSVFSISHEQKAEIRPHPLKLMSAKVIYNYDVT